MFKWFSKYIPKRRDDYITRIEPLCDVTIIRENKTNRPDEGTYGLLQTASGFVCHTMELPDRNNQSNISRIPAGRYSCVIYYSRKFGKVYLLESVKGRSYILTHTGNVAGDKHKGFKTNSFGCILLGKYRGKLQGQKAVMVSRPTLRSFMNEMGDKPFTLEIKEL